MTSKINLLNCCPRKRGYEVLFFFREKHSPIPAEILRKPNSVIGKSTMVAKLMKTLELHYPTSQFLITWNIPLVTFKKLMCIPRKYKRLVRYTTRKCCITSMCIS